MDSLTLSVIHPASEKLKRSSAWLHLSAAFLILTHAFSHFHSGESLAVYFWCQLIISLDIIILVIVGRDMLMQMPKVNLFFRFVEILFFLVIGMTMLLAGKPLLATIHVGLSLAYSYLFYCEKALRREISLSFHHTGITLPGVPEDRFVIWTHINGVEAHYDSVLINTADNAQLHYDLRKNLDFAELEQIHEFCRHYLGARADSAF